MRTACLLHTVFHRGVKPLLVGLTIFWGAVPITVAVDFEQEKSRVLTEVREPFRGWRETTNAFGDLSKLNGLRYHEPAQSTIPEISMDRHPRPTYDRIVRPFPHDAVVDGMNGLVGLAGAAAGIKSPDTLGPLDMKSRMDHLCAPYQGALRVTATSDGIFGVSEFSPTRRKDGRVISTDPQDWSNWKALPRAEAITRLNSAVDYQGQVHAGPDPSHSALLGKLTSPNPALEATRPIFQPEDNVFKHPRYEKPTFGKHGPDPITSDLLKSDIYRPDRTIDRHFDKFKF